MQIMIFHPEARRELYDAANYYENNRPGLGEIFLDAAEYAAWLIYANPFGWKKIRGDVRRCLLRRFPYGIIYYADQQQIFIIAVMHLHRKPNYWTSRLRDMPLS